MKLRLSLTALMLAAAVAFSASAPSLVQAGPATNPANKPLMGEIRRPLEKDGMGEAVCTSDTHRQGWVAFVGGDLESIMPVGDAFFKGYMPGYGDNGFVTTDGPVNGSRALIFTGVYIGYHEGSPSVWFDPNNCNQPAPTAAPQPQAPAAPAKPPPMYVTTSDYEELFWGPGGTSMQIWILPGRYEVTDQRYIEQGGWYRIQTRTDHGERWIQL